jgi:hypothetical protein
MGSPFDALKIPTSSGGGPFGSGHPHGPSNSPFGPRDYRIAGYGPGGPVLRMTVGPDARPLTPCEAYGQHLQEVRGAAASAAQQARKRQAVAESAQPFRPSEPTYHARASSEQLRASYAPIAGSRESASGAELDAGLRDCLARNNLRIDEGKAIVVLLSYFLRDHVEML